MILLTALSGGAAARPLALKLVRDVPLPGGPTRFDNLMLLTGMSGNRRQ
jgi:hypothetical protein